MGKLKIRPKGKHILVNNAPYPGSTRSFCGKLTYTIPLLKRVLPSDATHMLKLMLCPVCWANWQKRIKDENKQSGGEGPSDTAGPATQ